jgi:uncharacterized protein (UPF0261 family)
MGSVLVSDGVVVGVAAAEVEADAVEGPLAGGVVVPQAPRAGATARQHRSFHGKRVSCDMVRLVWKGSVPGCFTGRLAQWGPKGGGH